MTIDNKSDRQHRSGSIWVGVFLWFVPSEVAIAKRRPFAKEASFGIIPPTMAVKLKDQTKNNQNDGSASVTINTRKQSFLRFYF